MTNHVHFIAIPKNSDSLAFTFKYSHMRYSQYFNKKHKRVGHLWQGRFFSCPLGEKHLAQAIRYIERNPVRARMVKYPWEYLWSSAGVHSGVVQGKKGSDYKNSIEDKTGQSTRSKKQALGTVPIYPVPIFSLLSDVRELGFNWNPDGWKEYLGFADDEEFMKEIKMKTTSGRPFFSEEKIEEINKELDDNHKIRKRGRPGRK